MVSTLFRVGRSQTCPPHAWPMPCPQVFHDLHDSLKCVIRLAITYRILCSYLERWRDRPCETSATAYFHHGDGKADMVPTPAEMRAASLEDEGV